MAQKPSSRELTTARKAAAFTYGVARALDLGGGLVRQRGRFAYGPAGDAAALRGDWERAVTRGQDPHPVHESKKDGQK